ncbi:hypothetical protein WAE58_21810 [Pedobacter panaciterrae]|uniref:Uncharacterized protein n=1 Tax=Pedobacter panaciterrae TaxID=363849 RepID=A0ABU8NS70_9SPHI
MITLEENKENLTEKVQAILNNLRHEVEHTRQLHSAGINNSLSSSLEGFYTNPLTALLDMHCTSKNSLKKMVSQLTIGFLHTQKALIKKAFQVDQNNKVVYYIVLNEDNTVNRNVFFEFLSLYDELGISDNLPILIKFLPERVMEKANLKDELLLN